MLKQRPIKQQLLVMFMLLVVVVIFVMFLTYTQATRMIVQNNEQYSAELLDKLSQSVQSRLSNMENVIRYVMHNNEVQRYFMAEDILEKFELFRRVEALLAAIGQVEQGIEAITLIGAGGNHVNLMADSRKKQMVMDTIGEIARHTHPDTSSKPYVAGLLKSGDGLSAISYVAIGARIHTSLPSQTIGHIVVLLNADAIFPKLDHEGAQGLGEFYIVDRNGTISGSSRAELIGGMLDPGLYEDGAHIVRETTVPRLDGKIISVYSKQQFYRGMDKIRLTYGLIFIGFISFSALFLWMLSRNIIEPVQTFLRYIQFVKTGNRRNPQRLRLEGYSEIMRMADKFNAMLDEIDRLTDHVIASETRIYMLEMMKKEAELAFLKQQVNPHFLYNTLESMKGMAAENGAGELREMIAALGRMLRYNIKGRERVSLREELDIARAYIMLQQFRFGDRFAVEYDLPEPLLDVQVIKMILQPILENAIIHGLETKLGGGVLQLGVRAAGTGDIVLWIKDNGIGIAPVRLREINDKLNHEADRSGTERESLHLGISNVHNRLRTTYGSPYGIKITSVPGEGTEVAFLLPREEEAADVQGHAR